MSRFLHTLLQREAGQAEALAPRLPSLYEVDLRSAALAGAGFAEPPPEPLESARPAPPAPGIPLPPALAAAPPAPGMPVQPTLAAAPPTRPAPSDPIPAPMAEAPAQTARVTEVKLAPPEQIFQPTVRDAHHDANPSQVKPDPSPTEGAQMEPLDSAPYRSSSVPPAAQQSPAARRPVLVEIALAAASHAAHPEPRRESALTPRRAQAAEPASARPEAPAPDVHITIGRVEVRAVPAAARPARAGNAAQAVTLEQYLSRRNGQGSR